MNRKELLEYSKEQVLPLAELISTMVAAAGAIPVQELIISNVVGHWLEDINKERNATGRKETIDETFRQYKERLDVVLTATKALQNNPNSQSVLVKDKNVKTELEDINIDDLRKGG